MRAVAIVIVLASCGGSQKPGDKASPPSTPRDADADEATRTKDIYISRDCFDNPLGEACR